jgi:hypothetical protein
MTIETSRSSLQRTYSLSPRESRRSTPSSVICRSSPRLRSSHVRSKGSNAKMRKKVNAIPGNHQLVMLTHAG